MAGCKNCTCGARDTVTMDKAEVRINETGYRSVHALTKISQGLLVVELPNETQFFPTKYSIELEPGVHVDCSDSVAGYINHSCNPNAAVIKGAIIAWKCIEPGDEITIDYKRTETHVAFPFSCSCGDKKCRGRIE